jgi:hypothetical protein
MTAAQVTKSDLDKLAVDIVRLLEPRFGAIEQQLGALDDKFDGLQSSVDAYAKKADSYMQEMLMLAHKVDRLERWMQQIAQATGVKLEY